MNEIEQRFERQARWQKARRDLSWPEKIRMAERLREAVVAFGKERREKAPFDAAQGRQVRRS